jgi:mannosyltransferase OCH1-like enzyme
MSYLATQNLCCSKFILWKLDEFPSSVYQEINKTFWHYINKDKVEIKTFSIKEFCISGFFKKGVCNSQTSLNSKFLVALSDMVRFVVLDKYPGIYTDGDTIYLKDMRFLWYFNFAYRWSFLHTYNTAVIGINKLIDPSINKIYDLINTVNASIDSLINQFHPQVLGSTISSLNNQTIYNYSPLLPLHPHFFDGAW